MKTLNGMVHTLEDRFNRLSFNAKVVIGACIFVAGGLWAYAWLIILAYAKN